MRAHEPSPNAANWAFCHMGQLNGTCSGIGPGCVCVCGRTEYQCVPCLINPQSSGELSLGRLLGHEKREATYLARATRASVFFFFFFFFLPSSLYKRPTNYPIVTLTALRRCGIGATPPCNVSCPQQPRAICVWGSQTCLLTRKLFTPIPPERRRSTEYRTLLLFFSLRQFGLPSLRLQSALPCLPHCKPPCAFSSDTYLSARHSPADLCCTGQVV